MSLSSTGNAVLESQRVASGNTQIRFALLPDGATQVDSWRRYSCSDHQSGVAGNSDRKSLQFRFFLNHSG